MFPRNIRKIEPWKLAQIAAVLRVEVEGHEWSGDQKLQSTFTKALEQSGLKRAGTQYDPKSGGGRTYEAQLRALGLVYRTTSKQLVFTKAGKHLADGEKPLPILRTMLLRLQYPSAYSLSRNVGIDPQIRVKPCVFVLQLLRSAKLDSYLTVDELCVPICFGHSPAAVDYCVDRILRMRAECESFEATTSIEDEIVLPRSENVLKNVSDIANTLKNWMISGGLISSDVGDDGVVQLREHSSARELISDALKHVEEFVPNAGVEESFQRAFGAYDGLKDTAHRWTGIHVTKVRPDETMILAEFFKLCGQELVGSVPESFVSYMDATYRFAPSRVREVIQPYLARTLDYYESHFLRLAGGGVDTAIAFEDAITRLLAERLALQAEHTGQRKRPAGKAGGYADILVRGPRGMIALIDAKASNAYNLPIDDMRAMQATYVSSFRELTGGVGSLASCLYVAGAFRGGVVPRFRQLQRDLGVRVGGWDAPSLLQLASKGAKPDSFSRLINDSL